ncbi:MAG: methionine adenosyltransferase [Candidatus Melainabacteria bacterium RIFCSPLOWO2_02_FULL_35_15]|nr:MAG: methionine adenosyltransferase [Candidatus Melainabacteria bacterium RIFCSPLOWO2_12_FULL_35_11]OGI13863.1 MAG: methionine adenosyltransferase [Candidatus Melainabacteria bacterium RIFCSPLOWO2_02_FULL_35_15]
MAKRLFTSESVTEGHPDKLCDQISDAVLDAALNSDPKSRVACETYATTGLVVIGGEITSRTQIDYDTLARKTIEEIGYAGPDSGGFDAHTCGILVCVKGQSPDIAQGVSTAKEHRDEDSNDEIDKLGAGDQGLMFGFACDETPELMPLPISLAQRLALKLSQVRKSGILPYLRPDGKTQVTVEYDEKGVPKRIDTLVISTQHAAKINGKTDNLDLQKFIEADMKEFVIKPVVDSLGHLIDKDTKYFINPSGRFVIGGPQGDAGLTGRKIIVDTYGGYARHGGGAFSGKDPTKVDRSACYAARYIAKNIVGAELAKQCEVQVSYAIGVAKPISVSVSTFGTGKIKDAALGDIINQIFDLRPLAIIKKLNLQNLPKLNKGVFYRNIASYGHFGRPDLKLPWEELDKIKELQKAANGAFAAA